MTKRQTQFKREHETEFGLKIAQVDPDTSKVISAVCQFCLYFGREEKVGSKRKATVNKKYFVAPFRKELYPKHLQSQHPLRWNGYQELETKEAKHEYFLLQPTPLCQAIKTYFDPSQAPMIENIDKNIIDVLIAKMFFDSNTEETSLSRVLQPFETMDDYYKVTIKNRLQFFCCIDYLSVGCSFSQAADIYTNTKERTGVASMASLTDTVVAEYARICCALNYMGLKNILKSKCWTFSIVLDMSNHMATGYLDIRIRLFSGGKQCNFHLVALPIEGAHTASTLFSEFERFFDEVCPPWREKILSCATDGDAKMTGRIKGFASKMEDTVLPGFIRIWCGARQLDLVMHRFYGCLLEDRFYHNLTDLIVFLRRQQTFEQKIGSKCPTVATTRWLSISNVSSWLRKHRLQVRELLEETNPRANPNDIFWITLFLVDDIAQQAAVTFKSLQSMNLILSQQRGSLIELNNFIKETYEIKGVQQEFDAGDIVTTDEESVTDNTKVVSKGGTCSILCSTVKEQCEDMGTFMLDLMDNSDEAGLSNLYKSVAYSVATLSEQLHCAVAERDSNNDASDSLLPVVPKALVRTRGKAFSALIHKHSARLHQTFTAVETDKIEDEFRSLTIAYARDDKLRRLIDAAEPNIGFSDAWYHIQDRFPVLHEFVGGLATVFPSTSSVESDFSILKWTKDEFSSSLTDFSLEGVLHAKQFYELQGISTA